jgi:hypothetical protein
MEIIAKIIDSLAWPVVVIWLGYLFRGEIRILFGRISQLTYKDLQLNLKKNLK